MPQAPAPAPEPEARAIPDFDDECYRELFAMGDPEGEIWVGEFLEAADRLGDELRRLIGSDPAQNHAEIDATAHRLAGAALSVGAMRLGEAARALEHAAASGQSALLHARHAGLAEEFTRARRAIEAFITGCREGVTPCR